MLHLLLLFYLCCLRTLTIFSEIILLDLWILAGQLAGSSDPNTVHQSIFFLTRLDFLCGSIINCIILVLHQTETDYCSCSDNKLVFTLTVYT